MKESYAKTLVEEILIVAPPQMSYSFFMQGALWHIGRGLQLLGLLWAPYALYVGVTGQDSRKELMMLLVAAFQFLMGYFLIQISGAKK